MASEVWARHARERSWWTKPWAMNRPSRRCTTRCSRCRWTTSSSILPVSSKTTGRIGESRRHSQNFCSRGLGRTQGVHRVGPGRDRPLAAGRWQGSSYRGGPSAAPSTGLRGCGSHQFQGAGDRGAEMVLVQGRCSFAIRTIEYASGRSARARHPDARGSPPVPLPRSRAYRRPGRADSMSFSIASIRSRRMPCFKVSASRASITWDKAAQLLLDAFGLPHQHGEDAVFRPLLVDEVVAEDLVGLAWSLRSIRPLRCSMRLGFHGTSKWNRFQQ